MQLRQAKLTDLPAMLTILADAKQFLKQAGSTQWQSGYPDEHTLMTDIAEHTSYVLVDKDTVVALAAVVAGPEPTYQQLTDGQWYNPTDNYAVIHRMAISQRFRGHGLGTEFLTQLVAHFAPQYPSLRIDTFRTNAPMQHLAQKLGFQYCGKITVVDPIDPERLAYERLSTN